MMRMMKMPKYHVTSTVQMTYEIEAADEQDAFETYLDGKVIWDKWIDIEAAVVEEVSEDA